MSLSVGDARNSFSEVLASVERTHERVTVTRHGKPVAVVVSPDDIASLEETVALLTTPGAAAEVQEGIEQIEAGRLADWTALTEQYRAKE